MSRQLGVGVINRFAFLFAIFIFMPAAVFAQSESAVFDGGVRIGNPTGLCDASALGAVKYSTADGLIYCNGTTWLKVSDDTDMGAGSGSLDVSADFSDGSLRIGDVTTCDSATNEGTIRYVSANGIEYCDDSDTWVSASGPAPPGKVVFVSTTLPSGNLLSVAQGLGYGGSDGIEAADYICNDEASNASLTGTFMAWVTITTGDSPSVRFTQSALPYILPNGTQVADNWTDLTDGSLDSAIVIEADGTTQDPNSPLTNTLDDGTRASTSYHCNGWISGSSGFGMVYGASGTGSSWSDTNVAGCNASGGSLICFEQ